MYAEVLSVSALNRHARDLLESRFPLLWVTGEISNFVVARSGHWYFSLKDEAAQVRCVMFRSRGQLSDWQPSDGAHVEVRALVTLYEARGDFQLNVEMIRRAGQGAWYESFLRLKAKLELEGLFAEELKRPLPRWPTRIGIVTSLAAAALWDVLTTLARRNPCIPVIIYAAAVQGDGAPAAIVRALACASRRAECDVLILCRGGGSIEDLWAFNDERVARAIRASAIPIVCGVGHETDVTIADFAADRRAATPTAAAEMLSPLRTAMLEALAALAQRLARCMRRDLEARMQLADHLGRRLVHPRRRLEAQQAHVAQLALRLLHCAALAVARRQAALARVATRAGETVPRVAALEARVARAQQRLCVAMGQRLAAFDATLTRFGENLGHLDPSAVLRRGYSIVARHDGTIVRDSRTLAHDERITIAFATGRAAARVEEQL